MTPLRPAAIAVHDHRKMPRQTAKIQLLQQKSFLGGYGAERMRRGDMQRF